MKLRHYSSTGNLPCAHRSSDSTFVKIAKRIETRFAFLTILRAEVMKRKTRGEQTRTATATRGARKRLFPYFWRLCNSAYSYRGSNFLRFCQRFCCFIVSNYRRATVVVSQNDAPVLTTTQKWSNWSRTWGTTTPRSSQFHIFTCSFCLLQLV